MIEELIKELYKIVENNIDEYFPYKWTTYTHEGIDYIKKIEVNGFTIKIYIGYMVFIEIYKGEELIYMEDNKTNPISIIFWNSTGPRGKWSGKFRNLINRQASKRKRIEYENNKIKEELETERKNKFINEGIEGWINDLKNYSKTN